jgi:CRP-like cAMP-binding protein
VVSRAGMPLATLHAGEVFGEAALLADQPRNAEIHAQTALDVVVVSRDAFHELLGHVPGVQATMQRLAESRAPAAAEGKNSALAV